MLISAQKWFGKAVFTLQKGTFVLESAHLWTCNCTINSFVLTWYGTNKVDVIYLTFQLACSQLFNMEGGKQGMKLLDLLVVDVEATAWVRGGPPSLSLRSIVGRTLALQNRNFRLKFIIRKFEGTKAPTKIAIGQPRVSTKKFSNFFLSFFLRIKSSK